MDFIDFSTPRYGGFVNFDHHIYGADLIDNLAITLTQRRSQVRVLFRPLFYPQGWGYLFNWGLYMGV